MLVNFNRNLLVEHLSLLRQFAPQSFTLDAYEYILHQDQKRTGFDIEALKLQEEISRLREENEALRSRYIGIACVLLPPELRFISPLMRVF